MSDKKVENHKVVTFTYVIKDQAGQLQEQSDIPLSYLHGNDERMFPKVAEALEGTSVGDTVEVTLTPEEGFGQPDPSLSYSDKIENVPPEYQHIGAEAMFQNEQGETTTMTVVKVENGMVTLDGNHPFAGKTMTFIITIKAIRDATAEEVGSGTVAEGFDMSKGLH